MALLALASLFAGCASDSGSGSDSRDRLRVLAASSLTDALRELADRFERSHPDVDVEISFGGSSSLVEQLQRGAEADVLVTADRRTMDRARAANLVGDDVTVVARNRLTLIVEDGNPEDIDDLEDLEREGLLVVLCAPEVPCGSLSSRVLEAARVEVEAASLEENVKGVVSKVAIGEADAGLAYETDALVASDDVDAVALPLAADAVFETEYPAAVVRDSARPDVAGSFVAHLVSEASLELLRDAGFRAP